MASSDSDNLNPYATDEGSDYVPSTSEDSECDNRNKNPAGNLHSYNGHVTPKRSRKRRRDPSNWKRSQMKEKRTKGGEYVSKGKTIRKKECQQYVHTCRYECASIDEEERKRLFSKLYSLSNYNVQTSLLASFINKIEPKKKTPGGNKQYSTVITLLGRRVCREFFCKTFDVTDRRFKVICSKIDKDGFVQLDKRGCHIPKNKISTSSRNFVINHINRFPRYKSHYSRNQNPNTRYLAPDLNIRKMYKIYVDFCTEENETPVKESYYRNVFNREFNLRFHYPHSDTCNRCDTLNNQIKTSNETDKIKYELELELHQRRAQKAVDGKHADVEKSKEVNDTTVLCFDLQKTLPTPLLTTNKVYYLRQLWTYNFCVYNLITGKSKMYIWHESMASRGSQEIGSCLLHYIKNLPPVITKVIAYSDACGGQNKNKNIAKLFMHIVRSTEIQQIDHTFFESGHSYMECDRSFALIEKNKRTNPQIFLPEHWSALIQKTSKSFEVYQMKATDFFSFDALNDILKDPKKDLEKKPIKWREIKWFSYEKDNPHAFKFKTTLQADGLFFQSEKCTKGVGRPVSNIILKTLNNEPVKIRYEKWENLQQLLPFVPPVYHNFFKNLPHSEKVNKQNKKQKSNPQATQTADGEEEEIEDTVEDTDIYVDLESDYE